MSQESKLITVEELAELLRTTAQGIYSKNYRGEIPKEAIFRTGSKSSRGKMLFRRAVIEKHFRLGGSK